MKEFRSDFDLKELQKRKFSQKTSKIRETNKIDNQNVLEKLPLNVSLPKLEDKNSSNSFIISPKSIDPEKLSNLLKCLSKTKGVNKDEISEDLVEKTIEFGQQKVAEQLCIPYRRYKSILNKVGIKTTAGRKVQNLKLETALANWAMEMKYTGTTLTRKMIQNKAAEIIKNLISQGDSSLEKVRLSKGWLDKFVKRHEEIKEYLTSQKGRKGL